MSTVTPQQYQSPATAPQPTTAPPPQPAIIASRRSCDADGVGLSHYILMDRKPAQ